MERISDMPNLGKKLEEQLTEAGIDTPEKLREEGSKEAWLKIFATDPSACINRLYAMEAAIQNINKKELSQEKKDELKAFVREAKGQK